MNGVVIKTGNYFAVYPVSKRKQIEEIVKREKGVDSLPEAFRIDGVYVVLEIDKGIYLIREYVPTDIKLLGDIVKEYIPLPHP